VAWITGQQPVEETWESYLEQLQSMGIEQYLQAYQSTFDASQGAS
jgi:hypothetical protein